MKPPTPLPMRVQLLFQKTEAMRYTSHLDLQRALERNFRRAELPLAYSQGYNPRPRIVLASPLPLGSTSAGELAEVWLSEAIPEDELITSLNTSAPPGINFLSADPIPDGTSKLPNRLVSAVYLAHFQQTPERLSDGVSKLLGTDTLPRERKGKAYDLRPLIEDLELDHTDAKGTALRMQLAARPGATGRPDEVLLALDVSPLTARLQRLEIILFQRIIEMSCPQCKAIEDVFDEEGAEKERRAYLKDGPDKQEQLLIEALKTAGVSDASIIDIGGGVGAVQIGLLDAGAEKVTSVEASTGYITSSRKIYEQRGLIENVRFQHGDFIELAENIDNADVVTLVRSLCCYPDFRSMVKLSVERAGKLYGLVSPRDTWWLKAAFRIGEPLLQLFQRTSFQIFVHPTDEVEEIIRQARD